jgi:hypothetical protein
MTCSHFAHTSITSLFVQGNWLISFINYAQQRNATVVMPVGVLLPSPSPQL